jgi:hypothetical protein
VGWLAESVLYSGLWADVGRASTHVRDATGQTKVRENGAN